jgi:hypothetical protein
MTTWLKTHAHALYALGFALFLLVQPWLVGEQTFTSHDWVKVAGAGYALVVTFVGANTTATIGRVAKQTAVVVMAALVTLDNVIDGEWSKQKLIQVIAAAIVAAGSLLASGPAKAVLPGNGHMGDVA